MTPLAALEARAAVEITQYEYPSRDWLVSDPSVPELILLGWGQVSLLLAVALKRERIDRFVVLRHPVDRAGVYAALMEPDRLPRLDFAGREMSIPALGLPRWLAAQGQEPGAQVAVHGNDAAACDLALTALQLGARSVAMVSTAGEAAGPGLLECDAVVHGWPLLDAVHRAALRAEARRIPIPAPEAWLARLNADPRVQWTHPGQADLTLVAGDRFPAALPALAPGSARNAVLNGGLSHATFPLLSMLAPDLAGTDAPLLHPSNLVRFGIPRLVAAISRDIFLRDAKALFSSFLGFETAEGLGGRLLGDR